MIESTSRISINSSTKNFSLIFNENVSITLSKNVSVTLNKNVSVTLNKNEKTEVFTDLNPSPSYQTNFDFRNKLEPLRKKTTSTAEKHELYKARMDIYFKAMKTPSTIES